VLDFSARPLFASRQPPQGYFRAPDDANALELVLEELREAVAPSRSRATSRIAKASARTSAPRFVGCNACHRDLLTQAISPDGDHVKVDPHLCMGAGACSTVCPSGRCPTSSRASPIAARS
jgi:TPP-dependent indolepyruvate ferredoxin oxidoreductase alpha subunit